MQEVKQPQKVLRVSVCVPECVCVCVGNKKMRGTSILSSPLLSYLISSLSLSLSILSSSVLLLSPLLFFTPFISLFSIPVFFSSSFLLPSSDGHSRLPGARGEAELDHWGWEADVMLLSV